jgi:hypothetical protein
MGDAFLIQNIFLIEEIPYVDTEPSFTTSGLVFYVDAAKQEPSGTTWNDLSGFNNHVTLVNGPTYVESTEQNNWGYFETTSSQHMRTPASQINVVRPFTAEIWIRHTNVSFSIMHKDTQYSLLLNSSPSTYNYADGSNWSYASYGGRSATNITATNVWKQIVYSKDNSNVVRVYVNGVFRDSRTFGGTFSNNSNPTWLYGYGVSTSQPPGTGMAGRISIARMYNRALSNAEVTTNFNAHRDRYGL